MLRMSSSFLPQVGAKRVLHEVMRGGMASSGRFVNCEDGLQIPW